MPRPRPKHAVLESRSDARLSWWELSGRLERLGLGREVQQFDHHFRQVLADVVDLCLERMEENR